MTYSQYANVEAFLDMKQKSWINAHVHIYEYFDGVAKILVPDNCKTAVVTMVDGKTSRSMKLIRNWLNTMVQLLFRLVSELPRISQMLKER